MAQRDDGALEIPDTLIRRDASRRFCGTIPVPPQSPAWVTRLASRAPVLQTNLNERSKIT
jgi:hypothetical protein